MLKPPKEWPFTGRVYPADAELRVINIHAKWADLMWHDPKRDLLIYLSTLPIDKYKVCGNLAV